MPADCTTKEETGHGKWFSGTQHISLFLCHKNVFASGNLRNLTKMS